MSEELKIASPSNEAAEASVPTAEESSGDEAEALTAGGQADTGDAAAPAKKKKSKRRKIKNALTGGASSSSAGVTERKITQEQLALLLEANPALKAEVANMSPSQLSEMMSKLSMADLLTGINVQGKNQKDMASYKFWGTQPVVKFDEKEKNKGMEDGPIKEIDISRVRKEPGELVEGFEWVLMDLTDEHELEEVFDLLSNHYVEDLEAMFRFKYSAEFLHW